MLRNPITLSSVRNRRRLIGKLVLKCMIPVPIAYRYCSVERKDFVKFLGILKDCNLKWKHHINFVSLKISKTIGILARLRHFAPTETLLMIYRSLILPYLSYGITVWGLAAKSYIKKLLMSYKNVLFD